MRKTNKVYLVCEFFKHGNLINFLKSRKVPYLLEQEMVLATQIILDALDLLH